MQKVWSKVRELIAFILSGAFIKADGYTHEHKVYAIYKDVHHIVFIRLSMWKLRDTFSLFHLSSRSAYLVSRLHSQSRTSSQPSTSTSSIALATSFSSIMFCHGLHNPNNTHITRHIQQRIVC